MRLFGSFCIFIGDESGGRQIPVSDSLGDEIHGLNVVKRGVGLGTDHRLAPDQLCWMNVFFSLINLDYSGQFWRFAGVLGGQFISCLEALDVFFV